MKPYTANWLNPDAYPPMNCEDTQRIAWEFLRRNEDYAGHFTAINKLKEGEFKNGIGKTSDSLLTTTDCTPAALEKETGLGYDQRMLGEGLKGKIAKPRLVFQSRWSLLEPVSPDQGYDPDVVKFINHSVKVKRPSARQRQSFRLSLAENEIMLRFRLDMNFALQLVSALARLKEEAVQYDKISENRGSLRKSRKDGVFKMAHVWLRCYDAYKAPEQFVDDSSRKRKRTSGPTAIVEHFLTEGPFLQDDPRATVNDKNPPDWKARAADYIKGKHYLKLLLPQASTNDMRAFYDLITQWGKRTTQVM